MFGLSRSFAAFVSLTLLAFRAAPAMAAPVTYTPFERGVIEAELRRTGGTLDANPEGKLISRVDIVRLEVFDESDPVPDFFNVFHTTSRDWALRDHLLFGPGEPFSSARVDESARNFRLLRQLSLVLIVPVDDGEPGRVRVLVITKDVWSLRLNSDFEVANGKLNYLLLNPTEENLFGTHASVGGMFALYPYTYSIGGVASQNRLFGSEFSAVVSYNQIFNRDTGHREGSSGRFVYALPQRSAEQKWAFTTGILWSDQLGRVAVRTRDERGLVWRQNLDRLGVRAYPDASYRLFVYDAERYVGGTEVTRSFGRVTKFDLTIGLNVDRRAYRPRVPAGTDPELARRFVEDVPLSDTLASPFVQLESYENRFLKTVELETLGLQEDVRLGHEALLRVYPASTRLGSSRDLVGVLSGLSYTVALGDGLARVVGTSTIEYAAEQKHQTLTDLSLRLATPRLGLGRLIFDGFVAARAYNYLNRMYAIGGGDRLRGYPLGDAQVTSSRSQRGQDVAVFNTEFRTSAVDILSAQCGLAAFYDVGDAGDALDDLDLKQSVGIGLRILLPQADRVVIRADWAVPLSPGYDRFPGGFFFTFEQAFGLRSLAPPDLEARFLQ